MNRIDRLFAITVLLQTRGRLRAQDLAEIFEVSERTIYRDMLALNESGIPVTGLAGAGYELVEGFTLPPLHFSIPEAEALFLGIAMLQAHSQGRLEQEAGMALVKVQAVLPEATRQGATRLAEMVNFTAPNIRFDLDTHHLASLQSAIKEQCVVRLHYYSLSAKEHTWRDVEPEKLEYHQGAWYLSGFCRLRNAPRAFRLSRVDGLHITEEKFQPRLILPDPPALIEATIRFQPEDLRWVRERQHYAFEKETPPDEHGRVIMHYRLSELNEIKPWLLSWGAAAEPLSPPALRQQIRTEVETLIKLLT